MKNKSLTLGILLMASTAGAEVCAVFNAAKDFVRLEVVTDPERGLIWSKMSAVPDNNCLNLEGDLLGDRTPAHAVIAMPDEPLIDHRSLGPETRGRLTPVVAWPRTDGSDWEIIYALWDFASERWSTPAYVDRVENFSDDLDPRLLVLDDKLQLVWTHSTSTQVLTLASDGTVVSLGFHHDILWSPPYVIGVGPVQVTTLPGETQATVVGATQP